MIDAVGPRASVTATRLPPRRPDTIPDDIACGDRVGVRSQDRARRWNSGGQRPVTVGRDRPDGGPTIIELVGQQKRGSCSRRIDLVVSRRGCVAKENFVAAGIRYGGPGQSPLGSTRLSVAHRKRG